MGQSGWTGFACAGICQVFGQRPKLSKLEAELIKVDAVLCAQLSATEAAQSSFIEIYNTIYTLYYI